MLSKLGVNKLASAGFDHGNYSNVIINDKEYSLNKRGLNIVIVKGNGEINIILIHIKLRNYQLYYIKPLLNNS